MMPEAESDLSDILRFLGIGEELILGEAAPLSTRVQTYRPRSNDTDHFIGWREESDDLNVEEIVNLWRTPSYEVIVSCRRGFIRAYSCLIYFISDHKYLSFNACQRWFTLFLNLRLGVSCTVNERKNEEMNSYTASYR